MSSSEHKSKNNSLHEDTDFRSLEAKRLACETKRLEVIGESFATEHCNRKRIRFDGAITLYGKR